MVVTSKTDIVELFRDFKKSTNDDAGNAVQEFINLRQPDLRDFIIGRAASISENESKSEEVFEGAMFLLSFAIYANIKCHPSAPKFSRNNIEVSVVRNSAFARDVAQMISLPNGESLFEKLYPLLTGNQVFRCVLDLTADLDRVLDFENRATVEEILFSTKVIIDLYDK